MQNGPLLAWEGLFLEDGMTQLFAYSKLEQFLEGDHSGPHYLRKVGRANLKTAVIIDRKSNKLLSTATKYVPDIFAEADLPTVEGTVYHASTSWVEMILRNNFKDWELSRIDKERISYKENPVKLQLPPREYEWNPYNHFVSGGPEDRTPEKCATKCAEDFVIDPALMQQILSAMRGKPHITEAYDSAVWPKRFDVGRDRTVVIEVGGGIGDRLYDPNNSIEVDPKNILAPVHVIEGAPRDVFEANKEEGESFQPERFGVFYLDKKSRQLIQLGLGETLNATVEGVVVGA